MKTIPKPALKVRDVFLDCISTVNNAVNKQALTDCVDILEAGETDFEQKFPLLEIYQIAQTLDISDDVGKAEMKSVYDYRMVKPGMPGNKYYNQIKSSALFGKCPLCSVRGVDTLDHYLPKSIYPVYAVTPINLIPACTPCNKSKLIDFPRTSQEQTLHPYFDNVENESWLSANVMQTFPVTFEYFVSPPPLWTNILKDRTRNHFNSFKLNELYTSHANEELRGAKNQLIRLYNNHPDLMKAHLEECYLSRLELGINSWQAVMYRSLSNNVWFCSGGVLI